MQQHFTRLFQLIILLQYSVVVFNISAILSPSDKSVFVNGNVEFNCRISTEQDYALVWLIDYNHEEEFTYYIDAESTTSFQHTAQGHGALSTQYSTGSDFTTGNVVHDLVLKINKVQLIDEGSYSCGYRTSVSILTPPFFEIQLNLLSNSANLSILVPPININPSCSFYPDVALESNSISLVTLTCALGGGKPLPSLTWYKGRPGGGSTAISSPLTQTNSLLYPITANDNGIQFICVANGPALASRGSLCSVIPLNISPSVSVTYLSMPIVENSDIIFNCTSSGFTSNSKLDWFYKGRIVSEVLLPSGFQIIDLSDTTSELHLFDVQLSDTNSEVKCRVQIPSGLTNEEAVFITVIQAPAPEVTTPQLELTTQTKRTSILEETIRDDPAAATGLTNSTLIPIVAAASGLVLILVVAIIATIIYRRHKNNKQKRRENSPLELDIPRYNIYKMGALSKNNESPSATRATRHDSVGYVINQISSVHNSPAAQRSVTMGSDHPYDPVNIGNQPAATRAPKSTPSASQPSETSPYANIFFGKEESISYADLDLSHVPQSDIIHGNPPSSPVHYSEIEGEL